MLNPTHLHYVYRYFDDVDGLLYVGESTNPAQRAQDHANDKAWWPEVARVTTDVFNDASAAKSEEKRAIRDEQPRYNVVGKPGPFVRGQRADEREQRRQQWWAEVRPGEPVPAPRPPAQTVTLARSWWVLPTYHYGNASCTARGRPDRTYESLFFLAGLLAVVLLIVGFFVWIHVRDVGRYGRGAVRRSAARARSQLTASTGPRTGGQR